MARKPHMREILNRGYETALKYPLFDSIFNRRSRRFGLGMELNDSSLEFKSSSPPVPLDELEEALLVWSGTGLTGLCLADLPPETGIDLLCQWTGRTWPSACNNHGTELFFTNDKGLYFVDVKKMLPKPHELDLFFRMGRDEKIERILDLYRESLLKIEDGRAELPDRMPGLFNFNQWNTNKPGTSVFIPVTDITEEYINLLLLYCSSTYGFTIIDDLTRKPAGIEKWIKIGRLKENVKLSLFDLEVRILTGLNVEQAFICQNMSLALQPLGLAGWTFSGFIPRFALGAAPQLFKGLGFTFIQPKKGAIDPPTTVPVGRDGVFHAYCPPYYKDMSEAIDAFFEHKNLAWRPEKPFPYLEPDKHLMKAPKPTERTVQIVKDVANYIYDTYGRFPAFVDPMYMRLVFQAMHLDLDFYDKYYPQGSYTDMHINHFRLFHPELEDPFAHREKKKRVTAKQSKRKRVKA
ncbi:MAG: hypothetical protein ACRENZ_04250 [Thermodesulfobacteriota bacterium]